MAAAFGLGDESLNEPLEDDLGAPIETVEDTEDAEGEMEE